MAMFKTIMPAPYFPMHINCLNQHSPISTWNDCPMAPPPVLGTQSKAGKGPSYVMSV